MIVLEAAVPATEIVGLPWIVLLAFLRLTTRPGFFQKPPSVNAAFDVVDAWVQQPSVTVPEPAARHVQTMHKHGAEVCSTDNNFGRFSRLRWRNPLAR